MGGVDKARQNHLGAPVLHGPLRLSPQLDQLMTNAGHSLGAYESMGLPTWPDSIPDYGPFAGFLTDLEHCVTMARDAPLFPESLVARLATAP